MDWEKITPELRKLLNPKNVRQPAPGRYGEYIEGWHAIAEANDIFGFGAWSYQITDLTEAYRERVWLEGRNGQKYEQWRCAYVCQIMVTVGDATRHDVGVGQGQGKPNALGDAIESAVKEAVTDALKRSLRTFGNRFGLALYDKTKANVGVDEDEPPASTKVPAPPRQIPVVPGRVASASPSDATPFDDGAADYDPADDAVAILIDHLKSSRDLGELKMIWAQIAKNPVAADPRVLAMKEQMKSAHTFPGDRVGAA